MMVAVYKSEPYEALIETYPARTQKPGRVQVEWACCGVGVNSPFFSILLGTSSRFKCYPKSLFCNA